MDNPIDSSAKEINIPESNSGQWFRNKTVLIVTILFAAWIIGMSIVLAGWIISKQLVKNNINSAQTSAPSVKASKVDIQLPDTAPVLGNKDAKVTMVIFADFQCPYCSQWQKTIFPALKSKYIDNGLAKLAYINFPFLGGESTVAAEAVLCAKDQDKFWEYHDLLFAQQKEENSGTFSDENLKAFAKQLKLNTDDFNVCFNTRQHRATVESELQLASSFAVDSTPTLFINGYRYEGVFKLSDYESIIETELKK